MPKLERDDLLFLDALRGSGRGSCSEAGLKERLREEGFSDEKYASVKRKLLFARYIGSVYGNITLEKRDYREVSVEA